MRWGKERDQRDLAYANCAFPEIFPVRVLARILKGLVVIRDVQGCKTSKRGLLTWYGRAPVSDCAPTIFSARSNAIRGASLGRVLHRI